MFFCERGEEKEREEGEREGGPLAGERLPRMSYIGKTCDPITENGISITFNLNIKYLKLDWHSRSLTSLKIRRAGKSPCMRWTKKEKGSRQIGKAKNVEVSDALLQQQI